MDGWMHIFRQEVAPGTYDEWLGDEISGGKSSVLHGEWFTGRYFPAGSSPWRLCRITERPDFGRVAPQISSATNK